jgi:hypothetical protein
VPVPASSGGVMSTGTTPPFTLAAASVQALAMSRNAFRSPSVFAPRAQLMHSSAKRRYSSAVAIHNASPVYGWEPMTPSQTEAGASPSMWCGFPLDLVHPKGDSVLQNGERQRHLRVMERLIFQVQIGDFFGALEEH